MNELVKSIIEKFPTRKLYLPLKGQRSDWNYHIMVTNPSFTDIWNRMTYWNMMGALSYICKFNLPLRTVGLQTMITELFTLNFFGLNTMRYQGFTEYKDNLLSSYSNQLKYTLNPDEFVLWNEPVINMADGKVVKIYNDALDMITREPFNRALVYQTANEVYGNSISIDTDKGIIFHYYGLKKGSFLRFKIGDEVKAGTEIGRVGCNGMIAKRPFLHLEVGIDGLPDILKTDKVPTMTVFPLPIVNFEQFYEVPLITDTRETREALERMYVKDIKYIYNAGHFMRAGSLVKKTSNK